MKIYKITFCLFFSTVLLFGGGKKAPKVAITYGFSGGRLGDNLIAYMHAKWLSYKYAIPLVYRPFNYAEQFAFSSEEMAMESFAKKYVKVRLINEKQLSVKPKKKTLYVVPYFPESSYENKQGEWKCRYTVDWEDKRFLSLLRQALRAKKTLRLSSLPEDTITVTMHVRRGGSYEAFNEGFPAKFPRDEFYIQGLERLYEVLGEQPLYVYIFTDDQQPEYIAQKFTKEFEGKNIQFAYRNEKNDHSCNVLEDFFAMMQFDCLIRSDSNFSLCTSKIKKFLVEIAPADCQNCKNVKLLPAFSLRMREGFKGFHLGETSFGKDWQEVMPIKYKEECL
jgi:hypothetical protein